MLMADESSGFFYSDFGAADGHEFSAGDGEDDGLCMDMDTFMGLLEEDHDNVNSQNSSEEMQKSSLDDLLRGSVPDAVNCNSSLFQSDIQEIGEMPVSRAILEAKDSEVGRSDDKSGSAGSSDAAFESRVLDSQMRIQTENSAVSFREWFSQGTGSDSFFTKGTGFADYNIQGCSTASSFEESSAHQITNCEDNLDANLRNVETGVHFEPVDEYICPKCM